MDAELYDVAVVGFGPTGVVAAALLGQAGLRVHVCDRLQGVYEFPRAVALDHEIMRVFQQLGVVDAIASYLEPFTPSEYYGADGQLIRRLTMVEPPYPQGYTPSLVFTQPLVERALRERVAQLPNVQVAQATELRALEVAEQSVTLELQPVAGAAERVRARWVIACDGAGSTVRSLLNVALEDLGFDEPWLVVDLRVNQRGLGKLPKTSVQYCEPERPCTFVIGPGNHRRWEISLKAGEDPREVATPEATWKLLSRWLTPQDGELWRQASYRFHALVAERFRHGRVFLAGDAAHMQPPFLGQGMCQGVRDVANLSWKLSAVARGEICGAAAEVLLDSYGVERKAHVRELTSRIKAIGAVICERDMCKARARDARLLAECGGVVKDTPRQDLLPRLTSGWLAASPSSARGTLSPQPRLAASGGGEAVLMDERFGHGWRLMLDSILPAPVPERGLTVVGVGASGSLETEGVVATWMRRHECHAALIRPDHYVYGVAATSRELQGLLAEWRAVLA
jgi:3-(3-hydroxy-phenyl)propionate hydroxylase